MYIDDKGNKIIVSQGIGYSLWGAFRVTGSGQSLKRIRAIPMVPSREKAIELLAQYAGKHGWTRVAEVDKDA